MKTLFFHSKYGRWIYLSLLLTIGGLLFFNPLYAFIPLGLSVILLFILDKNQAESMAELTIVLKEMKTGRLSSRLPYINSDPAQEKIRIALNTALDQTETTIIEMLGAMDAVTKGHTWRRLQIQGVDGSFKKALVKMQVMLDNLAERTADSEKIHNEIAEIHCQTRDSIEYASIIQRTILPNLSDFQNAFSDSFAHWKPKDIVGGDIWFFEPLANEGEYLLFVIDCTGHGVPGAFVTMLVKSIQRTIMLECRNTKKEIHQQFPSQILSIFNREIKHLLNQYKRESESNVGFDGGILYINKTEGIIRFAGAGTPLFLVDYEGKCTTIKSDRCSVGYRSSDENFIFTEQEFKIDSFDKIYLSTDGLFDQLGGNKDFPYGKARLISILEKNNHQSMEHIRRLIMNDVSYWRRNAEQNDDITFIGIKI